MAQVPLYLPISQVPVTAGLGVFNTTFSELFPQEYLQLLLLGQIAFLFLEPLWTYPMASAASPTCSDSELKCLSYLFVGGLNAIDPYPNKYLQTQVPEADVFLVSGEQGLQVTIGI